MRKRLGVVLVGVCLVAVFAPGNAHAGLGLLNTFVGHGGVSTDGLGQAGPGGTIQADVPAGSKVVHAWFYGSYFVSGAVPPADLTLNFDGTPVTLTVLQTLGSFLTSARADVTAQVAKKVGSGAGQTSFTVGSDPASLDGVALVVVYSNPKLPTQTIAVLDGAASTGGDTATFAFSKPIDPTAATFRAGLALGSGHSFQGEAGHLCGTQAAQSSLVDLNGKRLTSCAGNFDDGVGSNGALITVGGVGDGSDNPANPNQKPADGTSPRVNDDELYDLKPLLSKGDTQLAITSSNPSGDDLLFLAVISATGEADVSTGGGGAPPPPVVGKTVNVARVSGTVTCRSASSRTFKPLTAATQLKVGSECDATKGVIRLTAASGPGTKSVRHVGGAYATPTQTADFFQGRFIVTQEKKAQPFTQLTLSGGDFKTKCKKKTRGVDGASAADPLVRKLWGKGKGKFRTKGRYSSASVRGTYWNTEDHCNSTVTRVKQGSVTVQDTVKKKKVVVTSGHTYVAKAPGRQQRAAGSVRRTWLYRNWRPSL